MEHYEQTELYIQSPLFTTNTIMARLSDLLSELDVVDKLAEGQVNKLVANISEWSSSKQADSVFFILVGTGPGQATSTLTSMF